MLQGMSYINCKACINNTHTFCGSWHDFCGRNFKFMKQLNFIKIYSNEMQLFAGGAEAKV